MKKKSSKYILLILALLAVIIVAIGFEIWNTPHRNIKDAVALKTNAIALYQSLANDSSHSEPMYVNKVVAVTGTIKQVMKNQKKQQVILLQTGVDGGSVNCTMEKNIANIKEGDTITIKGICMGYSGEDLELQLQGDVFLIRCYGS